MNNQQIDTKAMIYVILLLSHLNTLCVTKYDLFDLPISQSHDAQTKINNLSTDDLLTIKTYCNEYNKILNKDENELSYKKDRDKLKKQIKNILEKKEIYIELKDSLDIVILNKIVGNRINNISKKNLPIILRNLSKQDILRINNYCNEFEDFKAKLSKEESAYVSGGAIIREIIRRDKMADAKSFAETNINIILTNNEHTKNLVLPNTFFECHDLTKPLATHTTISKILKKYKSTTQIRHVSKKDRRTLKGCCQKKYNPVDSLKSYLINSVE